MTEVIVQLAHGFVNCLTPLHMAMLVVGMAVLVLGAIAAILALLVPAIPFILLGFVIWSIVRANSAAHA